MKWFKHDSGANMDGKLQEVLLDYGLEGYGLYWYCLELISGKVDKDNVNFCLEHDSRIIARNTGSTAQKVQDIMNRFVELGLFENNEGSITCFKLAKRLDQSMTSNPAMRQIINKIKENHDKKPNNHDFLVNNHDPVMTESREYMINPDGVMQDKIRLDKIREEKNIPLRQSEIDRLFDKFWLSGMVKRDKKNTKKVFTRLLKALKNESPEEFTNKLCADIQARLAANQQGFSGLYPSTYLNGNRWEDEISAFENDNIPYEQIVDTFNNIVVDMNSVNVITDEKKGLIRDLWNYNDNHKNIEWWKGYFNYINKSDRLTNRVESGWKYDFEFLLKNNNFGKITDGVFHR